VAENRRSAWLGSCYRMSQNRDMGHPVVVDGAPGRFVCIPQSGSPASGRCGSFYLPFLDMDCLASENAPNFPLEISLNSTWASQGTLTPTAIDSLMPS